MDAEFEPVELYEAQRQDLMNALADSQESKRNKRGALSVAKFKALGRLVWTREEGVIADEVWDNQRDE